MVFSMAGFRYQLTSEGQAILTNGKVKVVTIPVDSIITVMGGPFTMGSGSPIGAATGPSP
jgi:hypothetical protein